MTIPCKNSGQADRQTSRKKGRHVVIKGLHEPTQMKYSTCAASSGLEQGAAWDKGNSESSGLEQGAALDKGNSESSGFKQAK